MLMELTLVKEQRRAVGPLCSCLETSGCATAGRTHEKLFVNCSCALQCLVLASPL